MTINKENQKGLIIAAFAAVYIIWGSTYLGIKYAIETLPPFLMSGLRFFIAGAILFLFAYFRNEPKPQLIHWKNSIIASVLLLLCGNGIVTWAEQYIDSSTAALLITLEPVWIVFLLWIFSGKRPSWTILIGVLIGLAGMVILTGHTSLSGMNKVNPIGVIALCISTLGWALGSLFSIKAKLPSSPIQLTGMQMLSGGLIMMLVGLIKGEWQVLDVNNISSTSAIAFFYLLIFGSLIGYTAYSFLLKHAHPSHVSTYAYVNPIIAVFLGWLLANEKITSQTIIASVLLVGAVVIITKNSKGKKA